MIDDRGVGERVGADAGARKTQDLIGRPVRQRAVAGRRGGRCRALPPKILRLRLPGGVIVVGGERRECRGQGGRIPRHNRREDVLLLRRQRLVGARDPSPDEGVGHRRADRDVSARGDVDHRHGPGRVVRRRCAGAHRVAAGPAGPCENADVPRRDRAPMREDEAPRRARVLRQARLHADGERRRDRRPRARHHVNGAEVHGVREKAVGAPPLRHNAAARHAEVSRLPGRESVQPEVDAAAIVGLRHDGAARHAEGGGAVPAEARVPNPGRAAPPRANRAAFDDDVHGRRRHRVVVGGLDKDAGAGCPRRLDRAAHHADGELVAKPVADGADAVKASLRVPDRGVAGNGDVAIARPAVSVDGERAGEGASAHADGDVARRRVAGAAEDLIGEGAARHLNGGVARPASFG